MQRRWLGPKSLLKTLDRGQTLRTAASALDSFQPAGTAGTQERGPGHGVWECVPFPGLCPQLGSRGGRTPAPTPTSMSRSLRNEEVLPLLLRCHRPEEDLGGGGGCWSLLAVPYSSHTASFPRTYRLPVHTEAYTTGSNLLQTFPESPALRARTGFPT